MTRAWCFLERTAQTVSTGLFIMFCLIEIGSRVMAYQCRKQNIAEGRHA